MGHLRPKYQGTRSHPTTLIRKILLAFIREVSVRISPGHYLEVFRGFPHAPPGECRDILKQATIFFQKKKSKDIRVTGREGP
jgi:hypothetical protein